MSPEELEVAKLRRLAQLKRQELDLRRSNRLQFFEPHPKQQLFFNAAKYHYRYARTGNRFGKALAEGEPVLTITGWRAIETIRPGDIVFDETGNPTLVTGFYPQGVKEIYRVTFSEGSWVDVCGEHKWKVCTPKNSDWKVITTKQLKGYESNPGQRHRIPVTEPVHFGEQQLPLNPYQLGLLLGDGCFSKHIKYTTNDPELAANFEDATYYGGFEYGLPKQPYGNAIDRLGLRGKVSDDKFIPEVYLHGSIEQRLALLQGLMDTDGFVNAKGNTAEYCSKSIKLIAGVMWLLDSLGFTHSRPTPHNGSYRITIYAPSKTLFRLKRKQDRCYKNGEVYRIVMSVKKLDQLKQAYCISVASPHHTFLTRSCIVTHNSEMGAAEDIAFALGYRPWIPEGDPLRTLGIPDHPTKGLIVTTDWDKSKEVFTEIEGGNQGKLIKYIPANALGQPTKNHSGAIDRIPVRHKSGGWSIIHLDTVKSYKQNPLGQESSVWDWCHIDEPIPEAMWQAIARGLVDRGGRAWFTCTPITEPWIDQAFVPELEDQSRADIAGVIVGEDSRWMMTGSMDDNPHNTAEYIANYMSWLPPEVQEARRKGLPLAYSGIVYKEFEWSVHVREEPPPGWVDWDHPPADWTKRFAIDYHPRKPHAVMFIATSPHGYNYVYNELWVGCLMSDLVDQIKEILGPQGATVPGLIDPLASTPNRVTDVTALDEVLRLGLPVLPATKDPHNGILRVKEFLKARDRLGGPMLMIRKGLRRTLFEISRGFIWDGETNKPVKDNDDMMENFYRLCLQGLDYIEPSTDLDYIVPREIPIQSFENVIAGDFQSFDEDDSKAARRRNRYRA